MLLMATAAKTPATLKPRRCKYCRAWFVPERTQAKNAIFCSPNHRKAFWRYGGLPFDKMKEQIMREVRKMVPTLVAEALANPGSLPKVQVYDPSKLVEEIAAVLRNGGTR